MSQPTRRELGLSVGMFCLTLGSSGLAYHLNFGGSSLDAATFAACMLGILLAHELGHYVVARRHGFELGLPLFIPFPTLFGTLGAVIRLRSAPRSRQALLEMGAAGPLSGMVVAIGVLILGLPHITMPEAPPPGTELFIFHDPLIVKILGFLLNGQVPDPMASYGPAAWAGWVGCFLTGMNLVPIGQLDGGHVVNALLPDRASTVTTILGVVFGVLGALGLARELGYGHLGWVGWLVWLGVLRFFRGTESMPSIPVEPGLPMRSRVIAAVTFVVFALTFLPVPISQVTVPM